MIIFSICLGLRFGNKRETYLEFQKRLKLKKRSDFGVEFKTTASEGIIFYIADDKNSDFIALFVKNGKLVYGFNCGSGPVYIESPQQINDGRYERSLYGIIETTIKLISFLKVALC